MQRIFDGLWFSLLIGVPVVGVLFMFLVYGAQMCSSEPENEEQIVVEDVPIYEGVKRAVAIGCEGDPSCEEVVYGIILADTKGLRKAEISHLRAELRLAFYFQVADWKDDRVVFPDNEDDPDREFRLVAYGFKRLYEQLHRWDLVLLAWWEGDLLQVITCFDGVDSNVSLESWIDENRGRFSSFPCAGPKGEWLGADVYQRLVRLYPRLRQIGQTYKARMDAAFP